MTNAGIFVARATPRARDETDWRADEHIPTSDREGFIVALLLGMLVLPYVACVAPMVIDQLPKDGAALEERGEYVDL